MLDKPKQWSAEYGSIFQDESVVAAYQYRPPYPPETFTFLLSLIPPTAAPRLVLDAGCGTGFIARPLAPLVDQVDAVDISELMLRTAQDLPGGNRSNIHWMAAPIETASLQGAYALIVAAASLHWMDWTRTLPRFAAQLAAGSVLALVEEWTQPNLWDSVVGSILGQYSINTDFTPYDMSTVAAELERRHLFELHGTHKVQPISFHQSINAWVESFHARNGFSRDRMGVDWASACDAELRAAINPYCPNGIVTQNVGARILWGVPLSGKNNTSSHD